MSSGYVTETELYQAALAAILLEQQQEKLNLARGMASERSDEEQKVLDARVREATSSTWTWLTKYTKTFNPHWKEEGYSSPYLPFPNWPFFPVLLEWLEDEEDTGPRLIEKSRDLMVTWAVTGYFTLQAMLGQEREIVVQTMNAEKAELPIAYAKCLYQSQPEWLRDAFPLPKPIEKQPANEFRVGSSVIFGIPAGLGKIRSYHPWGYFSDETAFQAEAAPAYDEALSTAKKVVLNSSAAPGWYFDFTRDAEIGNSE